MHPILFTLGSFELHSFGVLVALGLVAGLAWCVYAADRADIPRDKILDLGFWLILTGLLGARLLFVLVNGESYLAYFGDRFAEDGAAAGLWHSAVEVFAIWNGGIVWYGGLLAAFAVGVLLMRRLALPFWSTADLVAPGVMLGLAIGRLGCLAAGDDFGKVVLDSWDALQSGSQAAWWTVTFTDPRSLVPQDLLGKPLYPTQLWMSLNALGIFGLLLLVRRAKRFDGQVVLTMFLVYSVTRSIIEIFRGDAGRGFWFDGILSTNQVIGVGVFAVSTVMFIYCRRTQRAAAVRPA